jgi:hypothetical protein
MCAISLVGIPGHVWIWSDVTKLLSSSCWIQSIHPKSASREDMRAFRVIVWTDNLYSTAAISLERGCRPTQYNTLWYKVLFHLHSVEDHTTSLARGDPFIDASGQDGIPSKTESESLHRHTYSVWREGEVG